MEANKVILSLEEYNRLRDNEREHLEIISSFQNKNGYLEKQLKEELKIARDTIKKIRVVNENYIDYRITESTVNLKSKSILHLIRWKYKK